MGMPIRAALALQVILKFFAPLLDEGDGRHSGCVAERAEGAAQHVFGKIADVVDVFVDRAAFM
jgi:hypothetical protein